MLNILEYTWIYLKAEYTRILNVSDALHRMSEKFLRKPKRLLLYDHQKYHLKALRSHLQGLALTSETVIFKR